MDYCKKYIYYSNFITAFFITGVWTNIQHVYTPKILSVKKMIFLLVQEMFFIHIYEEIESYVIQMFLDF